MEQPLRAKRSADAVAIECRSALLRYPRGRHPWIDALSVVARLELGRSSTACSARGSDDVVEFGMAYLIHLSSPLLGME